MSIGGLTVDLVFIGFVSIIYFVWKQKAAALTFIYYSVITLVAHGFLAFFNYSYLLNIDFHFFMSCAAILFFLVLTNQIVGFKLLKFSVGIDVLLHAILLIKEPLYQLDLITYRSYTAIYDSYETARIIVVSLQILGLINGDKLVRHSDFSDRIYHFINRITNYLLAHTVSLRRVEKQ